VSARSTTRAQAALASSGELFVEQLGGGCRMRALVSLRIGLAPALRILSWFPFWQFTGRLLRRCGLLQSNRLEGKGVLVSVLRRPGLTRKLNAPRTVTTCRRIVPRAVRTRPRNRRPPRPTPLASWPPPLSV
jgi:hypothetical protein